MCLRYVEIYGIKDVDIYYLSKNGGLNWSSSNVLITDAKLTIIKIWLRATNLPDYLSK